DFSIIPAYVQNSPGTYGNAGYRVAGVVTQPGKGGWWGGDGNGNTYAAAMHRPAVADRVMKLYQALASYYNGHPLVEGGFFEENSFVYGAASNNACPDFSKSAIQANYQSTLVGTVASWTKTHVVFENTYFGDETSTQAYMDWMYQHR